MNSLIRFKYRALAMITSEARLLTERKVHERMCCINWGDGLGIDARNEYRRLAKAYNKARRSSLVGLLLRPVPMQPPMNAWELGS